MKKKFVVGEVVKRESKVGKGDIKSEESGSESSRRRKRETKKYDYKIGWQRKKNEESNDSKKN